MLQYRPSRMINHFASKKAIQAFRVIILTNHSCGKFFFSSRLIILTNHSCGRKISAPTWKINHFSKNCFSTNETSTSVFFGVLFYGIGLVFPTQCTENVCSHHTFFVCTHQSAARPRLSVENPRPERAVCREARSNLKAGSPPFISAVFERVARGGEGAWFLSSHRCWERPRCPLEYPSTVVFFTWGTHDSPEQW